MRARLVGVLVVPLIALFLVLGAAYGRSISIGAQQDLYLDRLGDASYFVTSARQALRTGDPGVIDGELERYREVYGITATVLDRSGETWASSGLDVMAFDESAWNTVETALSGRSIEPSHQALPWTYDALVVAEPIFDEGDLIGVVVTSSDTDQTAGDVLRQWGMLAVGGLVAVGVALVLMMRLASWVLRPIRRVDKAMNEIWHGHMKARISDTTGPQELRHVIAVFNSMAEEVEHLIHRQQEFVSNASHELRNPLNALQLRIEHLRMSAPPELADEVEWVWAEAQRMTRILDALLLLARGRDAEPEISSVDLVGLVGRRLDAWRPISQQRDVALVLENRGPVQCTVDEIMVESAFDAVLDNAVKFAPDGTSVEVAVANGADMVEIAVRDHGPGLALDEAERATERFWRSARHQSIPGSGLGLAIASEFLGSCGGTLDMSAADGGGLVVSLRVPADGGAR